MNRLFLLMRNYKLYFSLMAVPLLFMISFQVSTPSQGSKELETEKSKRLKVSIQSQPNAPIVITTAAVDSTDPNTPSIKISLVNNSNLLVRAFTIRCDTQFGESKLTNCSLNNIRSFQNAFRPQETRTVTIDDANYSQPPQSASLSVDFVELLDGSRWGEDTYKSGERLDGWRAGAHAEAESLLGKIKTEGVNITLQNLQSKSPDVAFPSNASSEYMDGFRMGIDAIRARVVHTKNKTNLNVVVNELQRPVDLSDWR
ncbi:MAG: hypothetical protein V7641_4889 [Blastocatellia bacterium]